MAFDAFLKIDGIPGESQDDKHKGEIDVLSFSWGVTPVQPGVAAGDPTARQAATKLLRSCAIGKHFDKASVALLSRSCGGNKLPSAVLTIRNTSDFADAKGTVEYLIYTMSDVVVSSYAAGGNTQTDPVPVEQFSLNFSKVEMEVISSTGESTVGLCDGSV